MWTLDAINRTCQERWWIGTEGARETERQRETETETERDRERERERERETQRNLCCHYILIMIYIVK